MEVSSYSPGTFCWIDLATTDAAGSKNFYSQLLGWTAVDTPVGEDMVYSMMQKDGKNVCGLYQMDAGMLEQGIPAHWTSYISVADADAVADQVAAAGGTVLMPPVDVFEAGRMSQVQDATGAAFGLWQPKEHTGAQVIYEPGALGWNELYTNSPEAAAKFYADVFGWTATTSAMGSEGTEYTEFKAGENSIGGMLQIQAEWGEVPPNWSIYLSVDDCAASLQQAQDLGAEVIVPLMSVENIRFAFIKDPQGVYLGIAQVVAE